MDLLLEQIQKLGLNYKKRKLQPSQVQLFLGMVLDSRQAVTVRIPERQQAFTSFSGQLGALPSSRGPHGSHGACCPSRPPVHTTCPFVPGPVSARVPPDCGSGVLETSQGPLLMA